MLAGFGSIVVNCPGTTMNLSAKTDLYAMGNQQTQLLTDGTIPIILLGYPLVGGRAWLAPWFSRNSK